MYRRLLHALYAIEFLVATLAVFTVWREVGGQGHLDYMAWYWKLGIGLPAAYAIVQLTIATTLQRSSQRRRLLLWAGVLLALTIGAGAITYYYHVNEPGEDDEEEQGDITPAALVQLRPGKVIAGAHEFRFPVGS